MNNKIAILGIGYIGLPLALNLAQYYETVAFDIDKKLIARLKKQQDKSGEVKKNDFIKAKKIIFSYSSSDIKKCNYFIITVPTPVDIRNNPDLSIVVNATMRIIKYLKKGDTVILESTIYPGATDEIVIPLIEKHTDLKINEDFYLCYSPERANPGDKFHNVSRIPKVISGSSDEALKKIENIYKKVIKGGLVKVKNIKTAEAAKIIENTQRDVNIALINEFSIFCKKMNININEVLKASSTKWNFLNFKPGLVGGHCIGVDPYYLHYKAKQINLKLNTIISSRNINEKMPKYIFENIKKIAKRKKLLIPKSKTLIIGAAFKENCSDIRNSGSIKLAYNLKKSGSKVFIYDPLIKNKSSNFSKDYSFVNQLNKNFYDIIIYSVNHKIFSKLTINKLSKSFKKKYIFFDLKFKYKEKDVDSYI